MQRILSMILRSAVMAGLFAVASRLLGRRNAQSGRQVARLVNRARRWR